jgi:hypothetical protein
MGTRTILADAVLVTTQTTGTGTYSLGNALTGHFHPADVPITSGSRISYTVVDSLTAPTMRETGEGVLSSGSPWTLTRATIRRSLNGGVASGSAINWPVGTRYLYVTPLAANTPQYDTDNSLRAQNTAKAWASFNGTALNDSWNIASVTDHGVGDFTLTFTETQPSANYVALGAASALATDGFALILQPRVDTSQRNATSCRWNCVYDNGAGTRTLADATWMDVIFFGDP